MWHVWETGEVRTGYGRGDLRKGDDVEDLGVDGEIILKWVFKMWDGGMDWIDLAQNRGRWRALVNTIMNSVVP
jgi:hypothetical protein